MNRAPVRTMSRQQGRTLLEVMIAMAIGLVILTALGVVYVGTTQTDRQATSVNRMSEDAAIAFKLLGDNLRTAGFSPQRLLERAGAPIVGGAPQPKFVSNLRGSAGIYGCDNGFDNVSADFDDLQCATSGGGSSAVAIRFEDAAAPAGTTDYPFDCAGNSVTINESPVAGDRDYTPVESRFLVEGSGEQASLKCAGNGNSFNPEPLIQYVEQMQLRYELAEGSDTFRYVTASYINDSANSANWSQVVSVRVCLLMRSQNRNQSGASSYTDCDGNATASADGYLRRVFTTTYALRNHIGLAGE